MPSIKPVAVLILVFLLAGSCAAEHGLPAWYDTERNPETDLATAVSLADGRNIMIVVGGDWCSWCYTLDKFIKTNKDIQTKLAETFVILKVNYSEENLNEEFLGKYPEILGYPAILILDETGKYLASENSGELEEGKSYSKEAFLTFIARWK